MYYECENCGATFVEEYVREWGRTKETDGQGTAPRCNQLVENPSAPPARDSNGRVLDEPVMQLCGGQLQRINDPQLSLLAADMTVTKVTPITEGRRL